MMQLNEADVAHIMPKFSAVCARQTNTTISDMACQCTGIL